METNLWSEVTFENYFISNLSYLRPRFLFPISNDEVLIFRVTNQTQSNLGLVCNLKSLACNALESSNFTGYGNTKYPNFVRLNESEILIVSSFDERPSGYNRSFIFNTNSKSLSTFPPPKTEFYFSSLVKINSNEVIGCTYTGKCEILNITTKIWSPAPDLPESRTSLSGLYLNDKESYFFGSNSSYTKKGMIFNSNNKTWNLTSPSRYSGVDTLYNSPTGIEYTEFKSPIFLTSDNKIMVVRFEFDDIYIYSKKYYLEVFDPEKKKWVNLFRIPKNISSITRINSNDYLITSRKDYGDAIESSIFTYPLINR